MTASLCPQVKTGKGEGKEKSGKRSGKEQRVVREQERQERVVRRQSDATSAESSAPGGSSSWAMAKQGKALREERKGER
jgi:hypothetical protein